MQSLFSRLRDRPDSEHEQVLLRSGISLIVVIYLMAQLFVAGDAGGSLSALAIATTFLTFSFGLFAALLIQPGVSVARRTVAMIVDQSTISLFLHFGEQVAAPWFPLYLFVTFGNGFRYGRHYLGASTVLSAAGYAVVIATTEYWQQNSALAFGLLSGLLILPAYLATLLTRLTRERQRAEAASEAKSRFLANISHEMRTPLNATIGMTDLLLESELTAAQRTMAEMAQRSGHTLLSLINNVLDLSKIEAGRMEAERVAFDLKDILATVRAIASPSAAAKGIGFEIDIAPGTPFRLFGVAGHLQQVLLNLVSNAVKFTENGAVLLRVSWSAQAGDSVQMRFDVTDTGIGVAPELHDYIFTNFSQADESISRRFGGTGLGLAIAKQLVGQMGGAIGVESEPGRGSRFWFTASLEIDATETAEVTAPCRPAAARAGFSLLVADDNPLNREVLKLILEHGRHRVRAVADGQAALAALAVEQFDLVLMDVNMPEMSGLEATARYHRATPPGARVPIAALTADATPAMQQTCADAGMVACITKPVEMRSLLEQVDRLARPQPTVTQAAAAAT